MAVLLRLLVTSATRDQFNELDARVGQAMSDGGGPPPGLMSHVVYPEGDGFVVTESGIRNLRGRPTLTTCCVSWWPICT